MRLARPASRVSLSAVVVATAYGGPEVLTVVDEPAAEPGPGQARIEVRASVLTRSTTSSTAARWAAIWPRSARLRRHGLPPSRRPAAGELELGMKALGGGPGADPGTELRNAARPELARLAGEGGLRVLVSRTFPLEEAAAAHRAAMDGHPLGKIALIP